MATDLAIDTSKGYEKNQEEAEQFFRTFLRTSFTPSDLASILKENVTAAVPIALAEATWDLALSNPLLIESVISRLKSAVDLEDVKPLEVPDGANGPESLREIFLYTLGDTIRTSGHYDPDYPEESQIFVGDADENAEQPRVHPIIISSFVIAAARKLDFMQISEWYSMTLEGLQICDWELVEDRDVQEISAIAALIFFAMLGAEQFTSMVYLPEKGETYETVLDALKELKARQILRYEPGVVLLEKVISDVENHDTQQMSMEDVWRELFVKRG